MSRTICAHMCEHLLVDRFLFADPLTAAQTNQRGIPDAHTKASSTIASVTLLSEPRGAIPFLRGPPRVKLFFAVRFGVFLSPHSQRCEALAKKWTGEFTQFPKALLSSMCSSGCTLCSVARDDHLCKLQRVHQHPALPRALLGPLSPF